MTSNFTSSMVTYVLQELVMSCDPTDSPTAEMLAHEGHMVTKVWGPGPYFDVIPDSALPSFYLVDRENLLLQTGEVTLTPAPTPRAFMILRCSARHLPLAGLPDLNPSLSFW